MYRSVSLVVLSIIAVSEGCRPPPCHWSDAKPIEDYFNQVANVMIKADRQLQSFCNQHSTQNVKEVHTAKEYKLVYPSGGGDVFNIRVRDRVILIDGQSCTNTIADVRVLPAYVDGRAGSYTVEGLELVITFPYKYDPLLGGGMCIPPDASIVTLPQGCNDCNGIF